MFMCSYLALVSALACGADWVFIPEMPPEDDWEDNMCQKLSEVTTLHTRPTITNLKEAAAKDRPYFLLIRRKNKMGY